MTLDKRKGSIMKRTKRLNRKKRCILIVAGVSLLLFTGYLGIAVYFGGRFLYGTFVNGKDVSCKTAEEVESMIASEVDGYEIKIVPREGEEEWLAGEDVALKTVFDGTLQRQLAQQSGFAWPAALFRTSTIQVETMVDYSQEKMEEAARKLDVLDEANMRKPLDATISEYTGKEGYKILPEEKGTVVNEKKFIKALGKAIRNLDSSFSMEDAKCYKKPKYTKKSKELKKQVKTMNQYAKASITYDFGDSQEVLDGETIHQWISVDGQRNVSVSEEKIREYVSFLAETYNTAGKSKSLESSYGTEVTVSGGDYGWIIDQEQEVAALSGHIQNGESLTKEPAYAQTANSRGGNDYGDTYVEVNLTAQHLFYYKNGALVVESDFVSGNEAKGWSTPAGAFGLYYKQRDKTLRGEDYATPVSFWMPFNGGVGFHDATWRNSFGGSYYKRNGSHGCVNLPYNVAKTLYENIEAGCAVLVYKTPTDSAAAQEQARQEEQAQREAQERAKQEAQAQAAAVIQLIDALGEVTLDSRDAVANARNQFEALSGEAKALVSNYGALEAAELRIAQLDAEAAAAQQAQEEAQPVIDAINQFAGQEVTLDMKGAVESARAQYNQLSDAAKAKVSNYGALEAAEAQIRELESRPEEGDSPEA